MTHMLIGIVMSRAFSFGRDGTSPWMLNGPNVPLVVKNTFTCADAVDGTMHSMPSSTAAIPSFLMASSPQSWFVVVRTLVPTSRPTGAREHSATSSYMSRTRTSVLVRVSRPPSPGGRVMEEPSARTQYRHVGKFCQVPGSSGDGAEERRVGAPLSGPVRSGPPPSARRGGADAWGSEV